jgi:CheY-like chemotaxis protein
MSQRKILVVEDQADQRLAVGGRLRSEKYTVVFASDGVSAISTAQREAPDVIVLDLGLPAGDGFAVLERLGAIPKLAGIPIIVLTGRDPATTRDRALALGARAFLQKPVDVPQLLEAVRAAVEDEV